MYASNFATLNKSHFILLHEYINHELNDPLALLIPNRTTGRYAPDSTVAKSILCQSWPPYGITDLVI